MDAGSFTVSAAFGILMILASFGNLKGIVAGDLPLLEGSRAIRGLLLIGLVAIGYALWDRQSVIDRTCESLRLAMDFDAGGRQEGRTLSFEQTTNLFMRMPDLREATKVCRAAHAG